MTDDVASAHTCAPQHQRWLIAEAQACYDALHLELDQVRETVAQSRKVADDAWMTLKRRTGPLHSSVVVDYCKPRDP